MHPRRAASAILDAAREVCSIDNNEQVAQQNGCSFQLLGDSSAYDEANVQLPLHALRFLYFVGGISAIEFTDELSRSRLAVDC